MKETNSISSTRTGQRQNVCNFVLRLYNSQGCDLGFKAIAQPTDSSRLQDTYVLPTIWKVWKKAKTVGVYVYDEIPTRGTRGDPKGGVVLKRTKRQPRQSKSGNCIKRRGKGGVGGEGVPKYMRQSELFGRQWFLLLLMLTKRLLFELLCEKSIDCGTARGMAGAWAGVWVGNTRYTINRRLRER